MTRPLVSSAEDTQTGVLVAGSVWGSSLANVWQMQFGPYPNKRYLLGISIIPPTGMPPGNALTLFRGRTMWANSPSGIATSFTSRLYQRIIYRGMPVYMVWFYGGGNAPQATLFAQQDGVR